MIEEINYIAVLICAVLSMIVGSIWYGPVFGKKWMEIIKISLEDEQKRKEMQKESWKLYIVQFALVIIQLLVLASLISNLDSWNGFKAALCIWFGFVMPTIASTSMWNNDSKKVVWSRFLIQSGYQFVMFVIFGLILSFWK